MGSGGVCAGGWVWMGETTTGEGARTWCKNGTQLMWNCLGLNPSNLYEFHIFLKSGMLHNWLIFALYASKMDGIVEMYTHTEMYFNN